MTGHSTHRVVPKCLGTPKWKSWKEDIAWKPHGQVEDNTKFDLKQVGCKIVDRKYSAEESPMKEQ